MDLQVGVMQGLGFPVLLGPFNGVLYLQGGYIGITYGLGFPVPLF